MANTHSCTIPLEVAKQVLKMVESIGYDGMKAYALTHNMLEMYSEFNYKAKEFYVDQSEDFKDYLDNAATICGNGQNYLGMWLNDIPHPSDLQNHLPIDKMESIVMSLAEGVYFGEYIGLEESHWWVWVIHGEQVTYAATYGGVKKVTRLEFEKEKYLESFIRAMHGSVADYIHVFGLDNVEFTCIAAESFRIFKSNKYANP